MAEDAPEKMLIPLYVDLDGTLIAADTLVENVKLVLRRKPWAVFLLPLFLLGGRASLKERLARMAAVDPTALPYRDEVIEFLREERARGRSLVLATAAHRIIAEAVAGHLRIFDSIIATDRSHNLKGRAKLEVIRRHAGGKFAYMGDSMADLPVFEAAEQAYLVNPSSRLMAAAKATCRIERVFN